MSALLLLSISQVNKVDDKISECNEYWINLIDNGRVNYYGTTLPDNFTINSSAIPQFIKETSDAMEEEKNDY